MNSALKQHPLSVVGSKIVASLATLALVLSPFTQFQFAFAAPGDQMITNGSLDANTDNTAPTGWQIGGFDGAGPITDKAAFNYVAGRSGGETDKAVQVVVNQAITGGGDAKWVPADPIAVTSNTFYTFSDWYKSDVTTYLFVEYTHEGGAVDFHPFATLDPTNGSWVKTQLDFDVPSDVEAIRIFHVINMIGTLTTDDYFLTEVAGNTSNGGFSVPMITLTFDDAWYSQYENAFPKLSEANIPASFFAISTSTALASYDLIEIQGTQPGGVTAVSGANGTTWSPIYRDPTITEYWFSDLYQGDASTVTVTYTPAGGVETTVTASTLAQSVTPKHSGVKITLPATEPGTSVTIAHLADGAGTLTASEGSLMLVGTGYMNSMQLKDLVAAGNEVGNHTENHCSLSRLLSGDTSLCVFTLASGANASTEVANAQSVLEAMIGTTITTLAYPFGEYNSQIKSILTSNGITGARTVDSGYNRTNSDKLALKAMSVDADTTLQDVQGWVETTKANNLWLILVFHQIGDPNAPAETSKATFDAIIEYLQGQSANVSFKTLRDALTFMGQAPADTTAPVIAEHADVTMQAANENGVVVTYSAPATSDNVDPAGSATCAPASGTLFAIGTTTVTCNAVDAAGNNATPTTFSVIVTDPAPTPDTTAPVIAEHVDVKVVATSTDGLVIDYTLPTVADNVSTGLIATCAPASGSLFAIGTSTVTCNAVDTAGNNAASTSFKVEVYPVGSVISFACSDGVDNDGDGLSDRKDPGCYKTFNANDTDSYVAEDTDEANVPEESATPTPVFGGGGGGNGPISGTFLTLPVTTGSVLGTSTAPTCVALLTKLIKFGGKNDSAEVKKFQNFLNRKQNAGLPETGFFGKLTRAALHTFQINNKDAILAPLGLSKPTDNVGVKTREIINVQNCSMN